MPTHPRYASALDVLLNSMYASGVDFEDVLVVVGDCGADKDSVNEFRMRSGVRHVTVPNNLFEYNAHLGVVKAVADGIFCRTDEFAILHDTCVVGPNFVRKCEELRDWSASQIVWASDRGNFNLGIYRYEAVEAAANLLGPIMVMDKHFAIEMEHNFNHMSLKRLRVSQSFFPHEVGGGIVAKCEFYRGGGMRDVAYIPSMDLYKVFLWVPHGSHHPNKAAAGGIILA